MTQLNCVLLLYFKIYSHVSRTVIAIRNSLNMFYRLQNSWLKRTYIFVNIGLYLHNIMSEGLHWLVDLLIITTRIKEHQVFKMGLLFYNSVPNNKISYNVNYFSFCKKMGTWMLSPGDWWIVWSGMWTLWVCYLWLAKQLPNSKRKKKRDLGSLVRLSQHQIAFTKQRFDELSVSESGTYGLNFPWNTHAFQNGVGGVLS